MNQTPADIIDAELNFAGWSMAELARQICNIYGGNQNARTQSLSAILNGRARLSVAYAIQIAAAFNHPILAEDMLKAQIPLDLADERAKLRVLQH